MRSSPLVLLPGLLVPALACPPTLEWGDDDSQQDDDDATAPASVTVQPADLDFGEILVGCRGTGTVTVGNAGTGALQIEEIAFSDTSVFSLENAATFDVLLQPGEQTDLVVAFEPLANSEVQETMTIGTSDTVSPEAPVSLAGRGTVAFQFVPDGWDFGSALVGCEQQVDVMLGNVGTQAITLAGMGIQDLGGQGEMSLAGSPDLPLSIDPGGFATVRVRYQPADAGPDTGILAASSDDPACSPWTAEFHGDAVLAAEQVDSFVGDGAQAVFALSRTPVQETLAVQVGGLPATEGWSFSPATGAVQFDAGHVPGAGVAVQASYSPWGCEF